MITIKPFCSEENQSLFMPAMFDCVVSCLCQSKIFILDGSACMYVARTSTKFSDLFKTFKLDHRLIIGVNLINKRKIGVNVISI